MNRFPLVLLLLAAPATAMADGPKAPSDPQYADTAIGALLDANGGRVPATGIQLVHALSMLGDFVQLAIPFSAVDAHSGLTHPRVVFAPRPSSHPVPVFAAVSNSGFGGGGGSSGGGGWGGSSPRPTPAPRPAKPAGPVHQSPLGQKHAAESNVEGRLFLAANTEVQAGRPVVKSVEFLSWNSSKFKYDFGVIEGLGGGTPVLKVLDGTRCFSCHKNRGPILGEAPWSNSMHSDGVRAAAKAVLKFPHESDDKGNEIASRPLLDTIDGIAYLKPQAVEVDAAIREGAERLRDRGTVERLVKSENGRQVLAAMFDVLASRKPIGDDKAVREEMNRLDLVKFLQEDFAAQKAAPSNRLLDFRPSGNATIARYDAARAAEDVGLPSAHQPSNPKAFARPLAKAQHASDALTLLGLARAIGLSESDRRFLAAALDEAGRRLATPGSTPSASGLAKEIFAGSNFADVFATGVLPDRDDFKDRFVAALQDLANGRNESARLQFTRSTYASAPKRDPDARAKPEKAPIPSHACLACHDVRGAKPPAFNPIPALAFDPFDSVGRSAWIKTADRAKRVQVLARLVQRMNADRDMPPEDSREADAFRGREFDAVKDWLAAELKKAKG